MDEIARTNAERQRQLETLDRLAQRFGQSLSGALASGTASGRQLDGVLGAIGTKLATSLGSSVTGALGSTLSTGLESAIRSLTSSLTLGTGALPFAAGGVVAGGRVTPFASGGIVSAPTYFPMAKGLGLMGEAGPEAVLPLARGPDGRLGIASGGAATQVTVNVQATDLDSFKRSETQIAAALARAVARGRRAL